MNPTLTNIILTLILVVIFGAAILYIVKSFKSGKKCIGCPEGCSCGSKNKSEDVDCCNFEPVNTYINVTGSCENNCTQCNSCNDCK